MHDSGVQFSQKRLSLLQVGHIESFGEPAVDRREKVSGLIPFPLLAPKPRHARGCAAQRISPAVHARLRAPASPLMSPAAGCAIVSALSSTPGGADDRIRNLS